MGAGREEVNEMSDDKVAIAICIGLIVLSLLCTLAWYASIIAIGAKIVQRIFGA